MAYTRIHAIKTTLNKALDYIENPAKRRSNFLCPVIMLILFLRQLSIV